MPAVTQVSAWEEGHRDRISQWAQSGERAPQRLLPCQISQWLNINQSFFGQISMSSLSMASGVEATLKRNLSDSLATCVSTTTPSLIP
ncbi:MAG: hypothetical protein FJ405_19975, partial [Verrucomicrobia bacterium]|nr:hypothetical protein [Verrucomicrobiota bacterium]